MSDIVLNIDPAVRLNITGVYKGRSFEIVFRNYTDSTKTTPKDWVGTFTVIICRDIAMTRHILTITEGPNLIVSGNELIFKLSKTDNILPVGNLVYQIVNDIIPDKSFPLFRGVMPVNPSA